MQCGEEGGGGGAVECGCFGQEEAVQEAKKVRFSLFFTSTICYSAAELQYRMSTSLTVAGCLCDYMSTEKKCRRSE